ncbi:TonB-dependent receptor [Mucilaginibacter sp. X4EP1]|uniref:TonB-dependent receptor n=1 Tax=Mucilaginibacter sp. X4EP1 TaxID=2723092 RepID=UPI00216A0DDD|nr:TonB-dependent receptor [Mucilaginibacter sp. X4EP1]MCS3815211.1 hypothetical protein [Mucilaginibacter sp. X4EP1]
MKKKLFSLALFILFFQTIAFCQTDSTVIKNAVSKLKALLTEHVTEQAYLHFDRPYPFYVAGESIYFKAYVTEGELHKPTNISGMLHVDLINKNNTIIQTELIQLNSGLGWGDFSLSDTLKKGVYRVRAYTQWMLNEKPTNFYEQYISVGSTNSVDKIAEAAKQSNQPVIQFFPEGGNLVDDIPTKVAFKAIGTNGLGIDVKGVIVDNTNQEVAKITSSHLGMGVFDFIPESGKKYRAKVIFANGSENTVDLPDAEEKGITLYVNAANPAKLAIEIRTNRAYYKEHLNEDLDLLIYWSGSVKTVATKLDNAILGLDLPTAGLKTGAVMVSLLSKTGEPLSERLAFVQNPDQLKLSLNTDKPVYNKREPVKLNLNAQDKAGLNVNGSFSVSVIDESKILVDDDAENTILSYLLLTSQLKGYIEKPNYYFANVTKETRSNLDVLMLTQGYRRFVWKQLLNENNNTTATNLPEQYLNIAGTLIIKKNGVPVPNSKVILLPLGQTTTTDEKGHFVFNNINFQSGTQLILKTASANGNNATILVLDKQKDTQAVDPIDPIQAGYNSKADILASLQNTPSQGPVTASLVSNSALVKQDRVIGLKKDDNYISSSMLGPGHANQVIHGEAIKNATLLSIGLNGVARNVTFVRDVPFLTGGEIISGGTEQLQPMMVAIDGTILPPGTGIDDINPSTVETVEVLRQDNAAIYGENANAGVLVITTRQLVGSDAAVSKETSPGIFVINPLGYYKAREFYSPVYSADVPANKLPDVRTTIFWKPDVITDASGNATLQYFNADGTGTYRIVIEGIDPNGNLGRQMLRYKVQ